MDEEKPSSGPGEAVGEQSLYAVLSMDHLTLLRTETDYSISVLNQLETAVQSRQVSDRFFTARRRARRRMRRAQFT